MNTDNLPPLPEPVGWLAVWHGEHRSFWRSSRLMRDKANAEDIVRRWNSAITPRTKSYAVEAIYTTDQVEEIRRAAVLADRERFRAMFDEALSDHSITWPGEVDILYEKMFPAAAIREGVK